MDLPFHNCRHLLNILRGGDELNIRTRDRWIAHKRMNTRHHGSGLGQHVECTRSSLWKRNFVRAVEKSFDESINFLLPDEGQGPQPSYCGFNVGSGEPEGFGGYLMTG